MASINTFINSFANNLGVTGTSRESIMAYMPAIAYTLYDGYYIYSPANTKVAIKDDNGVGVVMTKKLWESNKELFSGYTYKEGDEGKLLYEVATEHQADGTYNETKFTLDQENAATEYKHILKPFAMYSEKVGDWVINYTLDNYITIYGNVTDEETGEKKFVSKAGYLTDPARITGMIHNDISGITFNGKNIKPEYLSEQIAYKDGEKYKVNKFYYVYEAEGNTKVYFDAENKPFTLNKDSEIVYVENLTRPLYKKCTIYKENDSKPTYLEIYQNLLDGNWYTRNDKNEYKQIDSSIYKGVNEELKEDYSAINYCVESYVITNFVNSLGNLRRGFKNKFYK